MTSRNLRTRRTFRLETLEGRLAPSGFGHTTINHKDLPHRTPEVHTAKKPEAHTAEKAEVHKAETPDANDPSGPETAKG